MAKLTETELSLIETLGIARDLAQHAYEAANRRRAWKARNRHYKAIDTIDELICELTEKG